MFIKRGPMSSKMKSKSSTSTSATQETKAQKFVRLAEKRVSTAVKKVMLVGNLAGPSYDYTQEQVAKIESALATAVETTMARFVPKTPEAKAAQSSFKL